MQIHNIPPVFDENSSILILGSFPSVKSREQEFFYAHPQNRFWKVLSGVFSDACPVSVEQKKDFLLNHHVAVWDVIASCEISGSSDSSIRNAVANDVSLILSQSRVKRILANGTTAYTLYNKLILPVLSLPAVKLPSTSPANASWSLERLSEHWRNMILNDTEKLSSTISTN